MKIQKNKSLKKLNTWKINSKSKYFCEVKSEDDLLKVFEFIKEEKIKYFILGGGSNVVFLNDFYDGVIIKICNNKIKIDDNFVEVDAGVILDNLVDFLQKKNIYDFANLTSIPGTVGGAIYGNAGAYGLEIGELVEKITIFDLKMAKFREFSLKTCNFAYRNSSFKEKQNRFVIYKVFFNLKRDKKENNQSYKRLQDFFSRNLKEREVRSKIKEIRKEKFGDLKKIGTSGSIFKNVEISKYKLNKLKKDFPNMKFWPINNSKVKISTGFLLDKILNIKGKKYGNIEINSNNALVFYSKKEIKGIELYNLIEKIKKDLMEKALVNIEPEVIFVK